MFELLYEFFKCKRQVGQSLENYWIQFAKSGARIEFDNQEGSLDRHQIELHLEDEYQLEIMLVKTAGKSGRRSNRKGGTSTCIVRVQNNTREEKKQEPKPARVSPRSTDATSPVPTYPLSRSGSDPTLRCRAVLVDAGANPRSCLGHDTASTWRSWEDFSFVERQAELICRKLEVLVAFGRRTIGSVVPRTIVH
ncbi:hypothetical protein JTB14_027188 [Gonioctena quinquepunctata]|nr:hypothetical protein JTB14_027188 [Gonioctena quinquepunctata]